MNVRNCRYNFLKSFAGHLKIHFSTAIYIRKRSEAAKMSTLRASILICTLKTKIFKIILDPFRQVYNNLENLRQLRPISLSYIRYKLDLRLMI